MEKVNCGSMWITYCVVVGFCWWERDVDKLVEMWIKMGQKVAILGFIFAVSVKKNYPSKRLDTQGKSLVLSTPTM